MFRSLSLCEDTNTGKIILYFDTLSASIRLIGSCCCWLQCTCVHRSTSEVQDIRLKDNNPSHDTFLGLFDQKPWVGDSIPHLCIGHLLFRIWCSDVFSAGTGYFCFCTLLLWHGNKAGKILWLCCVGLNLNHFQIIEVPLYFWKRFHFLWLPQWPGLAMTLRSFHSLTLTHLFFKNFQPGPSSKDASLISSLLISCCGNYMLYILSTP